MKLLCFVLLLAPLFSCDGESGSSENTLTIFPIAPTPTPESQDTSELEVYISDGSIQCEFEGRSPEETAQILVNNGIEVLGSTCGNIVGLSTAAVCGGGTTSINVHEIRKENLEDAELLGFKPVNELQEGYSDDCAF